LNILFIYFSSEYRPRTLLSLSIIETIAQEDGHSTSIFDTSFYQSYLSPDEVNVYKSGILKEATNIEIPLKTSDPLDDLRQKIEEVQPQLIAFSFYLNHIEIQRELLTEVKKNYPDIKIVAGGSQCILNPTMSIQETYIDMICYGEGEILFKNLLRKLDAGEDLKTIRGLWLKNDDGSVHESEITELTPVDSIPIQNWDSYDPIQINGLYNGRAYRMGHVEFTRGCPYSCSYCAQAFLRKAFSDAGEGKFVRHKTPSVAVNEFKTLKEKYDLEMLYFVDGTFSAMATSVLEEFAYLYKREVDLPFIALVHPQTITERKAELLGIMGCVHVSIGLESGDEEFRGRVMRRPMKNARIVEAIQALRKNGIHVSAYNIIGMPGMDREHVFKTIMLNREAGANSSLVACFVPYPDDEITKFLIREKLLEPSQIKLVGKGATPSVKIKEMESEEIQGLYNTFNLYVRLPKFMFPIIRLLEKSTPINEFIRLRMYGLINIGEKIARKFNKSRRPVLPFPG
jgi:anaerobic magnesium-protoporphyrin IX monomethyl ester cyclase